MVKLRREMNDEKSPLLGKFSISINNSLFATWRLKIRGQFWISFRGSEIWGDSICFQPNFDQVFFKPLSIYILNLVCSSFLNLPQY